jgi:hypothetical protein
MSVYGIVDGEWMQAEELSKITHLALVGLIQPDPDEASTELMYLSLRRPWTARPGQPVAVEIHAAVHQGLGWGHVKPCLYDG